MRLVAITILLSATSMVGCQSKEREGKPILTPEMDPFRAGVPDSLKYLLPILDSVFYSDQKYRQGSQSINKFKNEVGNTDSENLKIVIPIIEKYGILSLKEIGSIGNMAIVMTIQHADLATQEKYLPLFRDALYKKKILPSNYAMLADRVAIKKGRMQIYGTQVAIDKDKAELIPVHDVDKVNERRFSIGLIETIESYLNRFGIEWNAGVYKDDLPRLLKKYQITSDSL